ncbi:MAG: hypothetical protein ABFS19_01215 [Thermodesulfobacteriota bacterium]
MKKVIGTLLALLTAGGAQAATETSMNFDIENVKPFLSRLIRIVDSGINEQQVNMMYEFTQSVPVESQKEMSFKVKYKGQNISFRYSVFMDDIDAPDLYFFTSPDLAAEIESEMDKFTEELGI